MKPEVEAIAKACEAVIGFFYEDNPPRIEEQEPVSDKFTGSERVVVLGVEGTWRGNLVLCFPVEALSSLAERFLGMPLMEGMEEAADEVLLELGNQIAARACREIEEAGIGRADLTPPSLISAPTPVRLAWNRPTSTVLRIAVDQELMRVAIGLAPGPRVGTK